MECVIDESVLICRPFILLKMVLGWCSLKYFLVRWCVTNICSLYSERIVLLRIKYEAKKGDHNCNSLVFEEF